MRTWCGRGLNVGGSFLCLTGDSTPALGGDQDRRTGQMSMTGLARVTGFLLVVVGGVDVVRGAELVKGPSVLVRAR